MTPKIHLIRHAQGFHNLCQTNSNIHDPLLTRRGKEQCTELQVNFPYHAGVDLLVSSPIRRTLYTSLMSFEHDIKTKGLTIIAFPEVQETSDLPCDTGSSPEELAKEFAGKPIDFSLVTHDWNIKTGRWSPAKEAIAQRALEAREWLMRRPESEIVVVTHGGFLHYITDDWESKDKFPGTGWANTEFRSYTFDPSRSNSHLIETEESKQRRAVKPLDHNEITQIRRSISRETADRAADVGPSSQGSQ